MAIPATFNPSQSSALAVGNVVTLHFDWGGPVTLPLSVNESLLPTFHTLVAIGPGGWQSGPRNDVHIIETFTYEQPQDNAQVVTINITLKEIVPSPIDPFVVRKCPAGMISDATGKPTPDITDVTIANNSTQPWQLYHFAHDNPPVVNPDGSLTGEVQGTSYYYNNEVQLGWDGALTLANVVDMRSNWDPQTNPLTVLVDKGGASERTLRATAELNLSFIFDTMHARYRLNGTIYEGETARANCNTGMIEGFSPGPGWLPADGYRDGREVRLTQPDGLEGGELWPLSTARAGGADIHFHPPGPFNVFVPGSA